MGNTSKGAKKAVKTKKKLYGSDIMAINGSKGGTKLWNMIRNGAQIKHNGGR